MDVKYGSVAQVCLFTSTDFTLQKGRQVTFNALSQRYLYNISMHSGIVHVTPHRPAMLHLGKRDYGHLISQYLKSEG